MLPWLGNRNENWLDVSDLDGMAPDEMPRQVPAADSDGIALTVCE